MTPNWYERAVAELEQQHAEGFISDQELHQGMRSLNDELREEAAQQADDLYRDMTGDW